VAHDVGVRPVEGVEDRGRVVGHVLESVGRERLKAARSNLRFQDRHIADLEAQIIDRLRS
jgi:hypothetical protein